MVSYDYFYDLLKGDYYSFNLKIYGQCIRP